MARTPLSRSKGQGHQAALLSAALTRKAAAAVSVETYWGRGKLLLRYVCSAAHEALGRPRGRRGAGAYCVATRTICCGCGLCSLSLVCWVDRMKRLTDRLCHVSSATSPATGVALCQMSSSTRCTKKTRTPPSLAVDLGGSELLAPKKRFVYYNKALVNRLLQQSVNPISTDRG